MVEDSIPYSGDDNMNYPDYEDMLLYASNTPKIDYSVWKMKEGIEIPIKQMKTSHIKNCIRTITRNEGWRKGYLKSLIIELVDRNEL